MLNSGIGNHLPENIYLIGMMGAGKSTVGPILAELCGYRFLDTDARIVAKTERTIAALFQEKGEATFRNTESEVIQEISAASHHVVSLGGGSVLRIQNWQCLEKTGKIIYLRAKPSTLLARVKETPESRPLLLDLPEDQLLPKIEALLEERKKIYERATLIFDTDHKTVDQVAHALVDILK